MVLALVYLLFAQHDSLKFSMYRQPPRKPRVTRQTFVTTVGSTNSKKVSGSLAGESSTNVNSGFASSEGRVLAYKEASAALVSQPLAPIGTPAVKSEIQADKTSQNIKYAIYISKSFLTNLFASEFFF